MSVRTLFYLVCNSCGDEFTNREYRSYFGSPEEVKEQGIENGWGIDIPVANGSKWDFCPTCLEAHNEEAYSHAWT